MTDATSTMPTDGRWGWYRDHQGRDFRRVSKLLEYIETKPGTFNLRRYDDRELAVGLAIRDDLVLGLKSIARPAPGEKYDKQTAEKIAGIVKDARTAAKQRDGAVVGTAVHDLTERIDRGEPLADVIRPLPAAAAQDVAAYAFLIERNGWRAVEIERSVRCEQLGDVTGSLDRVYEIPSLSLLGPAVCQHGHEHAELLDVIGDVKTEERPLLNGIHIGPQLAIYSRARIMWRRLPGHTPEGRPNGEYVPSRCVRQDVAVVVHVRDGNAHPYFVKISAGWRAAERAFEQMIDELDAKREVGARGAWLSPMPRVIEPKPAELLTMVAAAKDYANPDRPQYAERPIAATPLAPDARSVPALPPLGEISTPAVMMIGDKVAHEPGETLQQDGVTTHVAVRRDDGLVEWQPAATEPHVDGLDLSKMLIAQIWQATTVERLGELWQLAQQHGVPWRGPVEQAGAARKRQIECPQRALHGGTGKCACGWMTGVAA